MSTTPVTINGVSQNIAPFSTLLDVRKKFGNNKIIGALINGYYKGWDNLITDNDSIEWIDFSHPLGKKIFWHTSAHVLAQAVLRLWPEAIPTIGPPIQEGFYYDFANLQISDKDLPSIELEAKKICKEGHRCIYKSFDSKKIAIETFQNNPYKIEILNNLLQADVISYYEQGEFCDLCKGPHLLSVSSIKAISFLKVSGAYWRGDSSKTMLTRIYGISFPSSEELKEYTFCLEERKRRDHKIVGPQLKLFMLREEAPGLPFILPKGLWIWDQLVNHIYSCQAKYGYQQIRTPLLMDQKLWKKSGHWDNYRENMYLTNIESRTFAVKPMSCPGAILFFASDVRSYRQLPFRVFEIGHVHRYEASGSLSGLMRVRGFHQDDAHIFLSLEMISDEVKTILNLIEDVYKPFGLSYTIELSTKPDDKHLLGDSDEWDFATRSLESALENVKHTIKHGEGAFYGPKIDIHIKDALNRTWQCATIQLDLFQSKNFDLEYIDQDGSRKRPAIIHRAIYGSVERFMGVLIEHFGGRFPLWLNPNQVCVLPISTKFIPAAIEIQKKLIEQEIRCEIFSEDETLSKRIRKAELNKFSYIVLIGEREVNERTLSVRTIHQQNSTYDLIGFVQKLRDEIATKEMCSSP